MGTFWDTVYIDDTVFRRWRFIIVGHFLLISISKDSESYRLLTLFCMIAEHLWRGTTALLISDYRWRLRMLQWRPSRFAPLIRQSCAAVGQRRVCGPWPVNNGPGTAWTRATSCHTIVSSSSSSSYESFITKMPLLRSPSAYGHSGANPPAGEKRAECGHLRLLKQIRSSLNTLVRFAGWSWRESWGSKIYRLLWDTS